VVVASSCISGAIVPTFKSLYFYIVLAKLVLNTPWFWLSIWVDKCAAAGYKLRKSRFKSNFYNYIWQMRQNLIVRIGANNFY
jgi:hypothetical protein